MKEIKWLSVIALTLSSIAMAAPPSVTGGALQQLRPPMAMPVLPPKMDIQRDTEPQVAEVKPDLLRIVVKSLQVTGSQAFPESDLIALTGFKPGRALTLGELRAMSLVIAKYFHTNGYPVALAYLPAQNINDGAVTITVTEGRYGKIMVRNQSNIAASVITDLITGLSVGDTVRSETLQRHLLILSDLPGVRVNSTLVPGAVYGTTDLMIDVLPGQRVSASIDADNAGNRATGEATVGATLTLNEPVGQGDVATLRLLTSGEGLNYFRAAYQLQIGRAQVGASYSSLDYTLGKEFQSLLANGTAKITSFYGRYPLIRSMNGNLYAGIDYDSKVFQDRMDSVGSVTDKTVRVLLASLTGSHRDHWGGGGDNNYSLTLTTGSVANLTPAVRALDASAAQSNGHFNKLGFSASRLQRVGTAYTLFAGIRGQFASKNLDISEKMALGGINGIRAYPEGEAYGDQGYVLTLEARYQLPESTWRLAGQMQLVGFVESGTVKLNIKPWNQEPNQRTLSAAGMGLNWWVSSDFLMQMTYAHRLGDEPARSAPDAADRLWLQAIKFF